MSDEKNENPAEETVENVEAVLEEEISASEGDADAMSSELAALQKKADEHYDQLVRAHAEIENLKRRHTQELEKAHKYALDKFVGELLTIWDSLELGLQAAQNDEADVASLREGTELTVKMFGDVMEKFNVERINPEGESFNPEFHQAMSMVPNAEMAPNTVMAVMQKGVSLNGRLIRPAMVVVSQAMPEAAE
ncbi:MAG: nucleotide exchange factor GrpE [Sedimenticolaceae bacterium]